MLRPAKVRNNARAFCSTSSTMGVSSFCLGFKSKDSPPRSWHARLDSFLNIGATTTNIHRYYGKHWSMLKDLRKPAIAVPTGSASVRLSVATEPTAFTKRVPRPANSSSFCRSTVTLSSGSASWIHPPSYPRTNFRHPLTWVSVRAGASFDFPMLLTRSVSGGTFPISRQYRHVEAFLRNFPVTNATPL